MKKQIIEAIRALDFEHAEQLWKDHDNNKGIMDDIFEWSFDTGSIVSYTFAQHLIAKNQEDASFLMSGHDLAIGLLVNPICRIEGAYFSAFYHVKEMIRQTNHQDTDYLEYLLLLHEVPDKVISYEEAEKTCYDILTLAPGNEIANNWLKIHKG